MTDYEVTVLVSADTEEDVVQLMLAIAELEETKRVHGAVASRRLAGEPA